MMAVWILLAGLALVLVLLLGGRLLQMLWGLLGGRKHVLAAQDEDRPRFLKQPW
jgi:hypothetical protein